VVNFARRYARMARQMAARASQEEDRRRLEEIAVACDWVPENPPRSLLEALQSFFLYPSGEYIEYSTLGIGVRFDKVFGPYYEKDSGTERSPGRKPLSSFSSSG